MRTFILRRNIDVSGISGTGVIAEGVEFHDGQVVLSWFGEHHTIEVSPSIKDVIDIHGHGGKTVVAWDKDKPSRCHRARRVTRRLTQTLWRGGK